MTYNFIEDTKSRKVGKIPTSYSPRETCPDTCPLKNGKCYGENFPIRLHWDRYSKDGIDNWSDFINDLKSWRKYYKGNLWRHNIVGDLINDKDNNNKIDVKKLYQLTQANKGGAVICYTHLHTVKNKAGKKRLSRYNLNRIKEAIKRGFMINLSASDVKEADKLADTGIPTTAVLPYTKKDYDNNKIDVKNLKTPKGRKIVVCPEQTHNIKCLDCKLCSNQKRETIIGFLSH